MQASLARKTLTITDIVDQLSHHLLRCHTGAFLIATNDNRSCRISLSAGRVTHCAFGRDYGDAAFDKIAEIQEGSYSFVKNAPQPTKARMQVNNKQAFDQLMSDLNEQAEDDLQETNRQKLPSGLTDRQMEALLGRFQFE